MPGDATPFRRLMEADGQTESAIRAFEAAYAQFTSGKTTMISEASIDAARDLPKLADLKATQKLDADQSAALVDATVVIKLNGGLGTGMGLEKAKSLLPVRSGDTFLDLIAQQILHLRETHGQSLRFLLMSSFATQADTAAALSPYAKLGQADTLQFIQSRVPKIDAETLAPAASPNQPDLAWCPPGHGDLYPALLGSGHLDRLLDAGVRYAFVSNSDNLGATLDLDLLHYFAQSDQAFLMEVTRRTAADRKGGHLAVDRETGHFLLRESAQCADADTASFQDIERHRYFNTNNLWLRLDLIKQTLDENDGLLPLPIISNGKNLDPRDKASTKVIQLEAAMGAAIGTLKNTGAIAVDRSRFAPVKTTEDLFALRSDAYRVTSDHRLELHPDRKGTPPNVVLDSAHYKLVDQLDASIPNGVPSLLACSQVEIQGPVVFESGVTLKGKVIIENKTTDRLTVPAGTYTDETIALG